MKLGIFSNTDFVEAVNELIEFELPAAVSFKISLIHQELSVENENFETAKREIILNYAKKDEDGELDSDEEGNIRIEEENVDALNNDLKELSESDFEVGQVTVAELGDVNLPPKIFSLLKGIIVA